MKKLLALGAVTLALAGCASGPYYDGYDDYGYGPGYYGYGPGYYGYGPGYYGYGGRYYDPYYYGPSYSYGAPVFGYYWYDQGGGRPWRDHDGRGNRPDRPSPPDRGRVAPGPSLHGEPGNEAGTRPLESGRGGGGIGAGGAGGYSQQ